MKSPLAEISERTNKRRHRARRRLLLLNAGLGWGVAHLIFMLLTLAVSPRLQLVLAELPFKGPLISSMEMTEILTEPFYLWGGLLASLVGGVAGLLVGVFEARVLESAGEVARGAELEETVSRRTLELTKQNALISELNRHLEESRSELERSNRELRETQERLLRTEKLAGITETAVSVNHQINGPLMIILGQSELLLQRIEQADKGELVRRIKLIESESLRIASITKRMATLVEPVTTPYLEGEGVRMLDVESSLAEEDTYPQASFQRSRNASST